MRGNQAHNQADTEIPHWTASQQTVSPSETQALTQAIGELCDMVAMLIDQNQTIVDMLVQDQVGDGLGDMSLGTLDS